MLEICLFTIQNLISASCISSSKHKIHKTWDLLNYSTAHLYIWQNAGDLLFRTDAGMDEIIEL